MKNRKPQILLLLAALLAAGNDAAIAQDSPGVLSGAELLLEGAPRPEGASPKVITRVELLDTFNRFVGLRQETNPHGYEKDLDFRMNFDISRGRIGKLIESDAPPRITPDKMTASLTTLLRAYEDNHDDFVQFYFTVIRNPSRPGDPKLASMLPSDIAAQILSLYLIVDEQDPILAENLKKWSYIWPFCRTRNHIDTPQGPRN